MCCFLLTLFSLPSFSLLLFLVLGSLIYMLSSFVTTVSLVTQKWQFCHHLLTLMSFQPVWVSLCWTQNKILKNQTVANHQLFDNQHSSKCLHVQHKKKLIQVNNDMRVSKGWRIFTFGWTILLLACILLSAVCDEWLFMYVWCLQWT